MQHRALSWAIAWDERHTPRTHEDEARYKRNRIFVGSAVVAAQLILAALTLVGVIAR